MDFMFKYVTKQQRPKKKFKRLLPSNTEKTAKSLKLP